MSTPTTDQGRTGTLEYIATTQFTSGLSPGGPTAIPPEFGALVESLAESAESSTIRLNARLCEAVTLHDLGRQELMAAQRDIARLNRIGALPNPTEYWRRSALPRAALLIDMSMNALVEEGEILGQALDRFMLGVDGSALQHWGSSTAGRATVDHVASQAIEQLNGAIPEATSIHALGRWWQRRLRRTAMLKSMPHVMIAGSKTDALIGRVEMDLLDRPPWSHGDRLLSAFELAHSEIRTQSELVADGLAKRVTRRGREQIAPSRRVTIELRE